MNLFYTTMTGYNDEQANPERSLGGFKSSTPVTNDDFSNLFDEISLMTIKTNRDEYRAIVLVNQFSETVKNIVIRLRRPDDAICSYKMAITPLNGVNKYNQHYMENVAEREFKAVSMLSLRIWFLERNLLFRNFNLRRKLGFGYVGI